MAPHALLRQRSSCTKELLTSSWKERLGPPVPLSAQLSGLHQPGHRKETDFLLSMYKPCQRHLYACPELADETNQAGYPWPITQITPWLMDCSPFKRLLDSSWSAPSIPMMLPFFPAMPHICSASYLVITVCAESTIHYMHTLRLIISIHRQLCNCHLTLLIRQLYRVGCLAYSKKILKLMVLSAEPVSITRLRDFVINIMRASYILTSQTLGVLLSGWPLTGADFITWPSSYGWAEEMWSWICVQKEEDYATANYRWSMTLAQVYLFHSEGV